MINFEKFSTQYTVKQITQDDIDQVLNVCNSNPMFYEFCPPEATKESILADMKALPDGKSMKDKYYVGFWKNDRLIAVVDFIDQFPNKSTAFIGFFMVDAGFHHQGIGTGIVQELCQYLKGQGYEHIRLGWVQGNDQSESFWHKNGFVELGVTYETDGYRVIVAQRDL